MTRRSSAGLSFETPERWADRSMVIVVAPPRADGAMAANIVVTREERTPGETLEAHARRQLEPISARFGHVTVLDSGVAEVAGRPAFKVRYHAKTPAGPLEQTTVYVDLRDPKWLTTMTASGPVGGASAAELERMMRGARIDAATLAAETRTLRALAPSTSTPPAAFLPGPAAFPPDPAAPWIPMPGERSPRSR